MVELSVFNPLKILYWKSEIESILRGEMPPPVLVTIDPSNRCNSNCKWCFVHDYRQASAVDLDRRVFERVMNQLGRRDGVKAIAFCGGGEPLMNPYTLSNIKLGGQLGVQLGLITNGTVFHNVDAETKIIADNCSYVRVSVDAAIRKTYQHLHGVDLFNNAVMFIKGLVKNRIKGRCAVNVSFMICPDNLGQVLDAAHLFKGYGVDSIIFKFVYSTYQGISPGFDTNAFLTEKQRAISNAIRKVKALETKDFNVSFRHPGTFGEREIVHQSKLFSRCFAQPLGLAGIAANGDVYSCCDRRGEMIMGNVNIQDFWKIWYSREHEAIFNTVDVQECPYRCKATEMNQIIEFGFLKKGFDWNNI